MQRLRWCGSGNSSRDGVDAQVVRRTVSLANWTARSYDQLSMGAMLAELMIARKMHSGRERFAERQPAKTCVCQPQILNGSACSDTYSSPSLAEAGLSVVAARPP